MAGILTAVGEAKVALSIGGTAIAFAALRIGDGNGASIVPNRLMTDLVRRVGDAYPVIASARDPENPTHWRVTTEIPAGEGPFTCREIAVFDAAGDMIAIAAHPTVEFTGPGGDQLSIITDIVFPVSGAANIAVTISPSAQMPITRNLRPFWLAVDSASVTAPPANPAVGASYIVPADATGAWAGQAGAVAQFTGEDWAIANVPVGHVACIIDQALNAAGRYLRRTADAWVPAEATDLAFGFARRATAAEIAAGNGNGFVTPAQMLGELEWAKIQNVPNEFPPSAHNHDDRYFTEAETTALLAGKSDTGHLHDGRYVLKTGDVMTGTLEIQVADNANALGIRGGGALRYTFCPIPNGANYGLQVFRYGGSAGNGPHALFDHDGSTRFYGAAQIDGNLALGAITPTAKLDVNGDTCLRGNIVSAVTNGYRLIAANPDASKTSGAYYQAFGSTHASLPGVHIFGSSGTDWLTLMGSGAVKFNGDPGTSSKVLVGNPSGPPTWTAITSLIGKKIIAIGTANSGNTINFATSEPDTSYSGIVWNGVGSDSSSNASTVGVGSISSKTTTSCVVTKGNTAGAPGMTGTDPVFFIIYR